MIGNRPPRGSLHLALSLLRIPKIFAVLVLFPLLFGLCLAALEFCLAWTFIDTFGLRSAEELDEPFVESRAKSWIWRELYGDLKELPELVICRSDSVDAACREEPKDVAIKNPNPTDEIIELYRRIFSGNIRTLHFCENCQADLSIYESGQGMRSEANGWRGYLLLQVSNFNPEFYLRARKISKDFLEERRVLGVKFLNLPGLRSGVPLDQLIFGISALSSLAFLLLIALFMTIFAHRRVLDYFAKSGALHPLVAAMGSVRFYRALWIITGVRALMFLVAAVPILVAILAAENKALLAAILFSGGPAELVLWLLTLVASFGLAALVASLSDLRGRSQIMLLCLRYVPFVLIGVGGIIWGMSFTNESELSNQLRAGLSALPLVGTLPMIFAPLLKPQYSLMILHCLGSLGFLILLLKRNAGWLAAHAEEV